MTTLHMISTGRQPLELFVKKIRQIHRYVDYIHLREKKWTAKQYMSVIQQMQEFGISKNKIIVNDRVDIAFAAEIGTVQLASHSIDSKIIRNKFPTLRIGCSVHSVEEAIEKEGNGADYLIYGHIYESNSKPGMPSRGLARLEEVVNHVAIPVIAIGGITPHNVHSVLQVGAEGVAILSGVLLAKDSNAAVKNYREAIKRTEVKIDEIDY